MLGVRGVPATYGGAETHVENIGARLAERGHDVTVFCRPGFSDDGRSSFRGMRLRTVPALRTKHLESISHAALSSIACLRGSFDIVHFHAIGPGLVAPIPRFLSSARVALTVHARDSERAKWGRGVGRILRVAEWASARVPDMTIVVSRDLERHYLERYGRQTRYIPNGVEPAVLRPAAEIKDRFGLEAKRYVLFVGRLVPEKAPDILMRAFATMPGDVRLVMAGGSSYSDEYVRDLQGLANNDPRIIMPGYVRGALLEELYSNAALFVIPSLLEGLPLVVLEAAAYGLPIVASDIPPNREILVDDDVSHHFFPPGDEQALAERMRSALEDLTAAEAGAHVLRERVLATYSWASVVDQLEKAYEDLGKS
jgi:glycosyltransferase involved in cell wall biosynthesis